MAEEEIKKESEEAQEEEQKEEKTQEEIEEELEKKDLEQLENKDPNADEDEDDIQYDDTCMVALKLSDYFYGSIKYITRGSAAITFIPTQKFVADKYGMIHSGIIESAGHYCALIAINHPNGVVSRTQSEFLTPVKKNMILEFEAHTNYNNISKKAVKVIGRHRKLVFYESIITILTMPEHPFENTIIGDELF